MNQKHQYFYQVQTQMLLTNIKMALLVAYTHKGIKVVHVLFDEEFCKVN